MITAPYKAPMHVLMLIGPQLDWQEFDKVHLEVVIETFKSDINIK